MIQDPDYQSKYNACVPLASKTICVLKEDSYAGYKIYKKCLEDYYSKFIIPEIEYTPIIIEEILTNLLNKERFVELGVYIQSLIDLYDTNQWDYNNRLLTNETSASEANNNSVEYTYALNKVVSSEYPFLLTRNLPLKLVELIFFFDFNNLNRPELEEFLQVCTQGGPKYNFFDYKEIYMMSLYKTVTLMINLFTTINAEYLKFKGSSIAKLQTLKQVYLSIQNLFTFQTLAIDNTVNTITTTYNRIGISWNMLSFPHKLYINIQVVNILIVTAMYNIQTLQTDFEGANINAKKISNYLESQYSNIQDFQSKLYGKTKYTNNRDLQVSYQMLPYLNIYYNPNYYDINLSKERTADYSTLLRWILYLATGINNIVYCAKNRGIQIMVYNSLYLLNNPSYSNMNLLNYFDSFFRKSYKSKRFVPKNAEFAKKVEQYIHLQLKMIKYYNTPFYVRVFNKVYSLNSITMRLIKYYIEGEYDNEIILMRIWAYIYRSWYLYESDKLYEIQEVLFYGGYKFNKIVEFLGSDISTDIFRKPKRKRKERVKNFDNFLKTVSTDINKNSESRFVMKKARKQRIEKNQKNQNYEYEVEGNLKSEDEDKIIYNPKKEVNNKNEEIQMLKEQNNLQKKTITDLKAKIDLMGDNIQKILNKLNLLRN